MSCGQPDWSHALRSLQCAPRRDPSRGVLAPDTALSAATAEDV